MSLLKIAKEFEAATTMAPGFSRQPKELEPEELASPPIPPPQDSAPRLDDDGSKRFYNSMGKLHRIDGPAVISSDGNKLYFQYGKLHREDGPAAIFFNGSSKWYMDGVELPPLEVLRFLINGGKISMHDMDTLIELSDLVFLNYNKMDIHALKQAGEILRERGCIAGNNVNNIIDFLKAAKKF